MSRGMLVLLAAALGLGLFVWLVEIPREHTRVESETAEKKLVDFKERDVQAVTLHSPAGDIEVARDSAGTWVILKPAKLAADQQAVEEFLRPFQLAKISRVVDESGTDLQSYGLAFPTLTVSVRLASGTQTLRLGDPGPLSSSLYVVREGSPKVLLTTLSGRDILSKSVQDFRRKRVLQFDRDRITRLKVTTSGEPVALNKEGQGEKSVWTITAPVKTAADQPEVRSLLFGLEDLKALSFLDDPKDRHAKLATLGKPSATFLLHEGDTDHELILYQDPQDKTAAYAAAGQDALVRIAPAAARDLTKNLFALRNKQLIAAEPDNVKTLVIKKDGQEYSLTHEGSDWLVDGDPDAKGDAARINMFVTRVVRLQAERIVTDKPSDLNPYGLTAPAAELIAADARGKLLGRISVGKQQEGLAYALGSAMPGVFQIRPDILREIPKKTELLAPRSQPQGGKQ